MSRNTNLPTLNLPGGLRTLLESSNREYFERDVLPGFLLASRWYGAKSDAQRKFEIVDWAVIPADPERMVLTFVQAAAGEDVSDLYLVPLYLKQANPGDEETPNHAIVNVEYDGNTAWLIDGLAQPELVNELFGIITAQGKIETQRGTMTGEVTSAAAELLGHSETQLDPTIGPPVSSNTLVFFGDRLLLKVFRRLEPGVNPDLEIGRQLTEATTFKNIPRVAGLMEFRPHDTNETITLGILQQRVHHQGDGWTNALNELHHYYERVIPLTAPAEVEQISLVESATREVPSEVATLMSESLESAHQLGERTAEVHVALDSLRDDEHFSPEPLKSKDVQNLDADIEHQLQRAFTGLKQRRDWLPESLHPVVDELIEHGPAQLQAILRDLGTEPPQATKIRIHGDYHLGQVLRIPNDYVLLDFEGEPARSITERRDKFSPIRDVAGMIRSFHYAAYAAAFSLAESQGTALPKLLVWAELWFKTVSAAFLRAYLDSTRHSDFVPDDPKELAKILDRFMLNKALYELAYEINNRPEWTRIPIAGLTTLLQRSQSP